MKTHEVESGTADRSRNVLGMVVLATFFVSLSWSTLAVALPVVVRHFHAGALAATLIALTPSSVSTALVLALGRVGDLAGRTTSYLLGLLAFVVASLLLGLAPGVGWLIGFEICEAVGIAAVWANSAAIIIETQPRHRVNQAFGLYIAAISVAELIGPTVGGVLADTAGWRWVFWINVPVGVACVLWGRSVFSRQRALATLEEEPSAAGRPRMRRGFDSAGGAFLVVGLLGLVGSLSLAQSEGISGGVLVGIAVSVAVLVGFVLVEMRVADPLIDLGLFRERVTSWALVSGLLNAMAQWVPVLVMALFFQAVQGRSPLVAGLEVTPLPICSGITAALAGRIGRSVSQRNLAVAGSLVGVAGLVLLAFATSGGYGEIAGALAVVGLGSGMFGPSIANVLLTGAPAEHAGAVNGARLTLQNLGWVVSTASVLTIVTAPLAVRVRHQFFAGTVTRLSPATSAPLHGSYRVALLVMAGLGFAGGVAAALSRRAGDRPQPEAGPGAD